MGNQLEHYQIKFQIGDNFQQSKTKLQGEIFFNQKKSEEQYNELLQRFGEHLDIDYSFIVVQKIIDNYQDEMLKALFNLKNRYIFEQFNIKLFSDNEFVYYSFKYKKEYESEFNDFLQVLLEEGLEENVQQNNNYFNFTIQLDKDFEQITNDLRTGMRFGSAFLEKSKLQFNLQFEKTLLDQIQNLIYANFKNILESPEFDFIQYCKMKNQTKNYQTIDELPDFIQSNRIFCKQWANIKPEEQAYELGRTRYIQRYTNSADHYIEMYITLKGLGCAKIQMIVPKFKQFFLAYNLYLTKILGLETKLPVPY